MTILTCGIEESDIERVLPLIMPIFMTTPENDPVLARNDAILTLAAYDPETKDELILTAQIISFSFQALEALGHARKPDLPVNKMLRLNGSAVSLSREASKAERNLRQLQHARRTGAPQSDVQPRPEPDPKIEKAVAPIKTARQEPSPPAEKKTGKYNGMTYTQYHQQRQRDKALAEIERKRELAAQAAAQTQTQHAHPA